MSRLRDTTADTSEAHARGWSAYRHGQPCPDDHGGQRGWIDAAHAGQGMANAAEAMAAQSRAALVALGEASSTIRALMPAKPTPRQRQMSTAALAAIDQALAAMARPLEAMTAPAQNSPPLRDGRR